MADRTTDWNVQQRPALMTRRYDFASYAETRQFLDDLAALSERAGYYPDLNFGKTHVNVSVAAQSQALGAIEYEFTAEVDTLAARLTH
ncbi:4a-hydroxytetrahydrobiopterin dehydratase [Parasulfuritortus cantonensis]|nr:4a-hydroxytetrahydrobiopterin dehydratase [Parasulfuritortus cantonensis]